MRGPGTRRDAGGHPVLSGAASSRKATLELLPARAFALPLRKGGEQKLESLGRAAPNWTSQFI